MPRPNLSHERLIKMLLPGRLVREMDDLIAASTAYESRRDFIVDAIEGHLAELQVPPDHHGASRRAVRDATPIGQKAIDSGGGSPAVSVAQTAIPPIEPGGPVLDPVVRAEAEPTWGMHNRDFPTLWALSHLARYTREAGGPVPLSSWTDQMVQRAWEMTEALGESRFDTSGFPSNPSKREASEGRFIRFFLGSESGEGPLFELGLAGLAGGRLAPTPAGLALLTALEGFSCDRGQKVRREWTEAYLRHLVDHAPADAGFLEEVLRQIAKGNSDRTTLISAIGADRPGWSASVLETNVAGFIARAREWGMIMPKQRRGRYVLEEDALQLISTAGMKGGPENGE